MNIWRSVLIMYILTAAQAVLGYPDFIGFNYRSCLVCHYSGTGGGALTDYGRGVLAGEIAARQTVGGFSDEISDEMSVEKSNFLGKKEMPWWIRPGIKTRNLRVDTAPGSKENLVKYYSMQLDLNLNFMFNEAQTKAFISTLGYAENENYISPNKYIKKDSYLFFREYFYRQKGGDSFWIYLGTMDKTFGIKHADHTSYNRSILGLGQNDQTTGALVQWAAKESDLFVHAWGGNAVLSSADRKSGGSLMYERKWGSQHAWGAGMLSEGKDQDSTGLLEIHGKFGYGEGNAILVEFGQKQTKTVSQESKSGYIFTQGDLRIQRGLFVISGGEYYKADLTSASTDILQWKLGFLWFPMQRVEFRVQAVDKKTFNSTSVEKDRWSVQSQLHLSL